MDKPLSTFSKLLLIGAGGLAVVAGPVLFLFPEGTATYFAWAIKNPLTPVFMGANYFGGIGAIWAMQTNRWSAARTLLPGILVFAITQLVATLLHIPIFNWGHPIAWAWLFVYVSSPVAAVIVILQMERDHRHPPDQVDGVPQIFRPVMLLFATVSGLVGLALFLWPALFSASASAGAVPWWAWSLTPLTARVIGGWYLAAAAYYGTLSRPHPPEAVRVALLGVLFATGLELLGALLHRDTFDGPILSIWLYVINAAAVLGFGLITWLRVTGTARGATSKAV